MGGGGSCDGKIKIPPFRLSRQSAVGIWEGGREDDVTQITLSGFFFIYSARFARSSLCGRRG